MCDNGSIESFNHDFYDGVSAIPTKFYVDLLN